MAPRNKVVPVGSRSKYPPRYRAVVDAYFLNNFNQMDALKAGGYVPTRAQANRLFRHPDVLRDIEERHARNRRRFNIDEDFVLQHLAAISTANMANIKMKLEQNNYDLMALTEDERYQIAEITTDIIKGQRGENTIERMRVKGNDRIAALVALGRHLGLFVDITKHDITDVTERLAAGRQRALQDRGRTIDGEAVKPK